MPSNDKRTILAEDLYELELISGVRLSPDGRHVLYAQQRVDAKTEKKYSNLWVVSTGLQPELRQFTYGDQVDNHPLWSPDGRQIAFFSNRGDKEKPTQIYLIPFDGGEARRLTEIPGQISDFAWSPDGKTLVLQVRKSDPEELERQQDEQKKKLGVVYRQYDRPFFKFDGAGYLPKERWHLWTVDVATGNAGQLTDGPVWDEQFPAWSPDGEWIAFLSNVQEKPDLHSDEVDLFVIPAGGGERRRLPTPAGRKFYPSFSPDGKWIAYLGISPPKLWYKNYGLWIVPFDGSCEAVNLTGPYDLNVSSWTINDLGQPEQMPPTWSNDSASLFFPVTLHGSSLIYSISRQGSALTEVIGGPGVAGSFNFDRDQTHLAYCYGKMDDPNQVYLLERKTGETRQLTHLNEALLSGIDLGQVEEHWIKGPEGNDLQGWILKPPGFNPEQQYPSILEIHGGPITQYGFLYMHEFYYLASKGFVVHFSNPRGGRGYGEAHAKAIWGSWGGADYDDLMAWTDFVAGQPYIDAGRMGVTGGSYGGYMTVWMIGHTDRYKAAVASRCVSNFISFWGSTDLNWTWQHLLGDKTPYENLEKYWDMSPMKYIGNARTPTLVIHNEFDLRCPIEQGEQVFVALQRQGVESEMVRFPDESHGLSRTGRTDRRIARLNHILRWFEKHL
jgi:dipeptidyl aminopeptidase/acylaminoacyl peptidase